MVTTGAAVWEEAAQGIVLVGAALAALGLIARGIRQAWRKVRAEWRVAAERLAKLDSMDSAVSTLHAEVKPNGGSSLRDAVDRVEARQVAQRDDLIDIRERVAVVEAYVDELKGREQRRGPRGRTPDPKS